MKCRICGNTDLKYYYSQGNKNQFKYYKCSNCCLVNLNLEELKHTDNQNKYSLNYKEPFDKKKNKGNYNTFLFIKKHLKKTKGNFLDIGCGNGSLLNFLKEDGWNVRGLELTPYLAEKVKETLAIDVDVVNFMEFDEFDNQYDALSLRHVIEHLPDSNLAMANLNKLLKPGGYAILEFPNIEGVNVNIKRFNKRISLLKPKFDPDYFPGHCNEFSRNSFRFLAEKHGFKVIRWETYSNKKFVNFILNVLKFGSKARVLIRKSKNN